MYQRPRPPAARPDRSELGRAGLHPVAIFALVAVAAVGATWTWFRSDRPAAGPRDADGPRAAERAPDPSAPDPQSTPSPQTDSRQETTAPSTPAARLLRVHGALVSWSEANGGHYPQTLAALAAADGSGRRYLGEADILDDFGRPWIYVAPSNRAPYQLHSFGRDGLPGGEGEDRDLFLADVLPD